MTSPYCCLERPPDDCYTNVSIFFMKNSTSATTPLTAIIQKKLVIIPPKHESHHHHPHNCRRSAGYDFDFIRLLVEVLPHLTEIQFDIDPYWYLFKMDQYRVVLPNLKYIYVSKEFLEEIEEFYTRIAYRHRTIFSNVRMSYSSLYFTHGLFCEQGINSNLTKLQCLTELFSELQGWVLLCILYSLFYTYIYTNSPLEKQALVLYYYLHYYHMMTVIPFA